MVRPFGRHRPLRSRKRLAGIALVAAAALTAAGCGGSSGSSSGGSSGGSASGLSNNGNTATWAEVAGFTPNFIFRFTRRRPLRDLEHLRPAVPAVPPAVLVR